MTDEFKNRELLDRVRTAIVGLDQLERVIPLVVPSRATGLVATIRAGLVAGLDEIGERP